jgi:hypothetical protein
METNSEDRMKELLRQALPPVDSRAEPARDLWPLLLKRLDARPAAPRWFDWALLAGLVALAALFPAAIPVFLYYL